MITSRFHGAIRDRAESLATMRMNGIHPIEVAELWSAEIQSLIPDNLALTGSFGRQEATFTSDLDLVPLGPVSPESLNALLSQGLAIDADGVSPFSKALPKTEAEWHDRMPGWALDPSQDQGVVYTGLLADLSHPVREEAARHFNGHEIVRGMLIDALSSRPPRVKGFLARGSIDLKHEFIVPIVKLARWGNLASGHSDLSTLRRLANINTTIISKEEAKDLSASFKSLMEFKMDIELDLVRDVIPGRSNSVLIGPLTDSHKSALEKSRKTIRAVQARLDYLLSTSTFSY